jgi:hypothetical protein
MSDDERHKAQKDQTLRIVLMMIMGLTVYNLYLGITVRKLGIPGIFVIEFGEKPPIPRPDLPWGPIDLPKPIATDGFALDRGRIYSHPNGNIRVMRDGNWVRVSVPPQVGMMRLTDDEPSLNFPLAQFNEGQWSTLLASPGNKILPVQIMIVDQQVRARWVMK